MSQDKPELTDQTFIKQFENLTLDPAYFDHHGHLRLAWIYLSNFDLETAIEKTCVGIKAYAESLGATDKFHWTITDALVRIMARRLEALADQSWPAFLECSQDLVNDAPTVLHEHYSVALLSSDGARHSVNPPDLKPL